MASATSGLRLPSQPQTIATDPWLVLISGPAEGRWLSWPEWLVKHRDGNQYPARTVTHPGTNRARCRVTSLMRPTTLALRYASTFSRSEALNFIYFITKLFLLINTVIIIIITEAMT